MSTTPPPPPEGPYGSGPQDPNSGQYGDQAGGQYGGQYGGGQQPPGQYPAGPGYGAYGQPATNSKAIWSLVLGILGLVCCGFLAGIPALILGNSAKKEIAASGGAQSGAGMAQAGFVLGIIAIVLGVLGVLLFVTGVIATPTGSTSP